MHKNNKMKRNELKETFILFLLLCTIFLQSCSNKKADFLNEDSIVIPDSIYAFFPKKKDLSGLKSHISEEANSIIDHREEENSRFLDSHLIKTYSSTNSIQFEHLIHEYKQEAIDSLRPIDRDYFFIMDEEEMLKMFSYKILKEKYQKSINKYILPSFHNHMRFLYGVNYNFTTPCGLPPNYEILIMKSGRDYILPDNNKWKVDWKVLPPELKHGYTSGIAYDTTANIIIYWCVAW